MQLQDKVMKALDSIRPGLQADGGDLEFVRVDADNVVHIKLVGACGGCPMAQMTLQMGVHKRLQKDFPEIKEVVSVD